MHNGDAEVSKANEKKAETPPPYCSYRLEKQMLGFTTNEVDLIRRSASISYTVAQRLINVIKLGKELI
jgi:hypothetical protein